MLFRAPCVPVGRLIGAGGVAVAGRRRRLRAADDHPVRRTGQGHRPDAGDADRATDDARAPGHGASVLLGAVRRRRQLAPDGEGLNMRACRAFRIPIPGARRWSLMTLPVLSTPLAPRVPTLSAPAAPPKP